MAFSSRSRKALTLTVALAAATALAACGAGKKDNNNKSSGAAGTGTNSSGAASGGKPITIGTTDQVVALDPAGSYDNGSLLLEDNIYQFLMSVAAGAKAPAPDAAQSCAFDKNDGHMYVCIMKPGLKFSNGDPLTAQDVAFSYQRIVKINNPNGPASLLGNMKSVSASGNNLVSASVKISPSSRKPSTQHLRVTNVSPNLA